MMCDADIFHFVFDFIYDVFAKQIFKNVVGFIFFKKKWHLGLVSCLETPLQFLKEDSMDGFILTAILKAHVRCFYEF